LTFWPKKLFIEHLLHWNALDVGETMENFDYFFAKNSMDLLSGEKYTFWKSNKNFGHSKCFFWHEFIKWGFLDEVLEIICAAMDTNEQNQCANCR